jgi:hypothetical protein
MGVSVGTISNWIEKYGFPVSRMPTGHLVTTLGLIDLWLIGRLKRPKKMTQELDRMVENMRLQAHEDLETGFEHGKSAGRNGRSKSPRTGGTRGLSPIEQARRLVAADPSLVPAILAKFDT